MDLDYNKVDAEVLPESNTRVSAAEYNQLAGSCMEIINASGLTPDAADNEQLLNALKTILGPHIVSTYHNNGEWCRIWSDGWCEQGGYSSSASVTFRQQMADTNYTLAFGSYRQGTSTSGDYRYVTAFSETGFTKSIDSNETFWWTVQGFIAQGN